MKRTIKSTFALILALLMTLCLFACKQQAETPETSAGTSEDGGDIAPEGLWKDATYLKDTEFGEGAKTVKVKVIVGEQSVTFTIKTDAETLGDALLAHGLIAGDQGDFGLYVKVVNGITADYDIDQSYWGFSKNGEYMMTGVDGTAIADGEVYELTYTK
jgi:hypothetical protein